MWAGTLESDNEAEKYIKVIPAALSLGVVVRSYQTCLHITICSSGQSFTGFPSLLWCWWKLVFSWLSSSERPIHFMLWEAEATHRKDRIVRAFSLSQSLISSICMRKVYADMKLCGPPINIDYLAINRLGFIHCAVNPEKLLPSTCGNGKGPVVWIHGDPVRRFDCKGAARLTEGPATAGVAARNPL